MGFGTLQERRVGKGEGLPGLLGFVPCKKINYVTSSCYSLVMSVTPWFITGNILAEWCMPCAAFKHCLPMASFTWVRRGRL